VEKIEEVPADRLITIREGAGVVSRTQLR
jgi:hypothetical protein